MGWSGCGRFLRRFVETRRGDLLADRRGVDEKAGREDEDLERRRVELRRVLLGRVDVDRGRDLVLDHHRHEDGARRRADAEARGDVRAVPDHHLLVAQHAVELRDEAGRGVEALHHLVVAAVRGEADALPSAERLAAEDEQRGARAVLKALFEKGVEDVDL